MHQEVLDNRAQRQRREESQRADDDHRSHQQADEQRAVRGEGAAGDGNLLLGRQAAGDRPAAES